MAAVLTRDGHERGASTFDTAGKIYVAFAIVWTFVLFAGLTLLFLRRNQPSIRMRDLYLVASSVLCLHVYLLIILLIYPLSGVFKCGSEFWIMGTYFPFGIALFQAQNIQLLSLSLRQKQLLWTPPRIAILERRSRRRALARLRERWNTSNMVERTYLCIAVGLIIQLATTTVLFFGSRMFHSSYGAFSKHGDAEHCRKGWEWLPTTFWQFAWNWVFGPYVLLQIRHINDVHHWSLQTKLCIIAGLPGTPLWIAALYSDKFATVNKWWAPAMWFAPGILTMQIVA
ncbi:hypothetical protein LTR66_013680, partial [Elasticomyces elasticus]